MLTTIAAPAKPGMNKKAYKTRELITTARDRIKTRRFLWVCVELSVLSSLALESWDGENEVKQINEDEFIRVIPRRRMEWI